MLELRSWQDRRARFRPRVVAPRRRSRDTAPADRRPSIFDGMSQAARFLTDRSGPAPWPPTGSSLRASKRDMSRARTGKARAIRSRFARRTPRPPRWPGVGASSRPAGVANRAAERPRSPIGRYQPSWRSIAPRSSNRVLISTTSRVPVRGSKARRSIHPCDRPWTTSTSRAVSQPARPQAPVDIARATSMDQVALVASPITTGGRGDELDLEVRARSRSVRRRPSGRVGTPESRSWRCNRG